MIIHDDSPNQGFLVCGGGGGRGGGMKWRQNMSTGKRGVGRESRARRPYSPFDLDYFNNYSSLSPRPLYIKLCDNWPSGF